MITALVSDIHSNLEALRAVLADIEERRVDRIVCLGDVINYGPDPVKCLRIVRKMDLCLVGNHEEGVLYEPIGFNPQAVEAAKWTRSVLEPSFLSDGGKWANWEFIRTLPAKHEEDGLLLVHASPRDPTSEYLLPSDGELIMGEIPDKLAQCLNLVERACFVGHTHIPGVFTPSSGYASPGELGGEFRLGPGQKAIINVGSVGQPRDHDVRASYATYDGEVVRFRRVEYDTQTTCAKIKAIKGLPDRGGTRLLKGE